MQSGTALLITAEQNHRVGCVCEGRLSKEACLKVWQQECNKQSSEIFVSAPLVVTFAPSSRASIFPRVCGG